MDIVFNAKFIPRISTQITLTEFEVVATVVDNLSLFGTGDILAGDVVFLDLFTSMSAPNSVGRYIVKQIVSLSGSEVTLRIEWADLGIPVDPVECLDADGLICRSSVNYHFGFLPGWSMQQVPEYIVQYAKNSEFWKVIDLNLGGSGSSDKKSIMAGETLVAGDFINIYDLAGSPRVRKARADMEGYSANGFIFADVNAGAMVDVYFKGLNSVLTGLTPGLAYFIHASLPGGVSHTAPSVVGNVIQMVGTAVSATELAVKFGDCVTIG